MTGCVGWAKKCDILFHDMIIWDANPVAIGPVAALGGLGWLGGLEVRWYSLFFALGVVLYYLITQWLWKRNGWKVSDFESLVVFLFVGLVVGARLGEVFFYQWDYYSSVPVEIFKVWKGGLSSHGATIGLVAAYAGFWGWRKTGGWKRISARISGWKKVCTCRLLGSRNGLNKPFGDQESRQEVSLYGQTLRGFSFMKYIDVVAVCMPLVAGFVRLGNFFNSEIVGRSSSAPWAVVFAQNGESFARHPVQLYEGFLAWVVFAVVMVLYLKKRHNDGRERELKAGRDEKIGSEKADDRGVGRGSIFHKPGFFLFLFVGLYFAGRFFIEFFKEYQIQVGSDGLPFGLTMGQALSILPVVVAVGWAGWNLKNRDYSKKR